MHGVRRVILFCAVTIILPITLLVIPLYLRHHLYADVVYAVTESDILEMTDGVSTIFCSAHTLQMNGTFNAFQMGQRPEVTSYRKHIRLKKSMRLPDDTLEYWGFYLLRGATVALSVCSRFPGSSILVVKGERTLRTCGLLDHNINKAHTTGIFLPQADQQVKITFESNAQVIEFEEPKNTLTRVSNGTRPNCINGKLAGNVAAQPIKLKNDEKPIVKKADSIDEVELATLTNTAESFVRRQIEKLESKTANVTRKLRHVKKRMHEKKNHHKRSHHKHNYHERNHHKHNHNERNHHKHNHNERNHHKRINHKNRSDRHKKNSEKKFNTSKRIEKLNSLKKELSFDGLDEEGEEIEGATLNIVKNDRRFKRNQEPLKPPALLDHGIQHGGNALRNSSESSVSSFEEGLFQCYGGQVLLVQEFDPSELCTNVSYLVNGKHMQMRHEVAEDGYYYYIFYSDNDIVFNDMHAVFDIYKPTFQYENVTKSCINDTECTFPLNMFSNDRVIVEVPTKDGIDHELDDISVLISICHPRMGMYTIFPIAVLLFVLSCAFV